MTRSMNNAYIVAAVRTAVGKAPRGVFHNTRPDDLLVHVLKGLLAKVPQLDPLSIEDVIIGCAMPEGEQGMNVARIAALLAGIPDAVPAMTINRFCASGLQAIALAFDRITTGQADVVIAGGTESMSLIPMGGKHLSANIEYFKNNEHASIAYGMGITAERVAKRYQISRIQQDEFSYQSHQRAITAQDNHDFAEEILSYSLIEEIPDLTANKIKTMKRSVMQDEGPRRDTSLEALAKLKTTFAAKGTVTAGNTSQMSDGAAALLVVSEKIIKELNLAPLAALKSYAVAGVAPEYMGIGPTVAIPKALKAADLKLTDIDWIELNEAFAAQVLAVMKLSELNPNLVNPLGGAIALGHPLGATGAIRATTLIHGMRRYKKKYGMVTMCIGTGMGAAGVFESYAIAQ